MNNLLNHQQAVIACHRFGLAPTGEQLEQAAANPQGFVLQQLTPPLFSNDLPSSSDIQKMLIQIRQEKKQGNNTNRRYPIETYHALSYDSILSSIKSEYTLNWRLLDFFSNHFSVSASGNTMRALAPTLEREAIAPNLFGTFEDMLIAVSQHPAMLIYLNNEKSFGPNSKLGRRGKGMNENLAREILELHTLGVNGGYNQQDVGELAKAITGWSLANPNKDQQTGFQFKAYGHEPGARLLLNKSYSQSGVKQGEAILRDLARHPNTARYMSTKLATHFVSDSPQKELIDDLSSTWLNTNGNLKQVIEKLVTHPLAWQQERQKYKTPRETLISTYRVCALIPQSARKTLTDLQKMGQKPFNAGSPAGYEDVAPAWNGSSALDARIEWTASIARMTRLSPMEMMQQQFGDTLNEQSFKMISRAESQQQGMALMLLSPEFVMR